MPAEIPLVLQAAARPLTGPDRGLVAWTWRDAPNVLAALTNTRVAITRGEVYRAMALEPVPVDDWECRRGPREDAPTYASRSQALAQRYVSRHLDEYTGIVLFVFVFDDQRVAA